MATPQEEMTSLEVVKLIEAEADEEGDILEEITNQDIKEIYQQLNQQDKKRFRRFRKFHRQYFGVYGEHLPSYHMARQVVKDLMPGLPSASADVIAKKRAELLAEDRLRKLCRRHGFKFPEREMRMEAPREEAAEDPTYRFLSVQDEYQAGLTTTTEEEIGQLLGAELLEHEPVPAVTQVTDPRPKSSISSVIKTEPGEDVKPTMRTTVLSQKRLLQWQGTGDEELIITRVTKGNDPLATYYNDDEATQEAIEIEETDTEDDLSEVSMQSHGDVNKAELKAALQGLTDSHRATANHLSVLSTMVTGMTEEQTSQAEEPPRKKTKKEGAPPPQPPAKGANKRKGRTPHRKFPGFLQDGAQYTGPCLRKAMRYPKVNRKKPVLYLHPIHKAVAGKEALQNVGYSHKSWERAHEARRDGRLVRIG